MLIASGGREVDMGGWGAEPNYKLMCNNDRVSFLPVKSSTVNLMNVRGPGCAIAGVLNDEV